MDRFPARFDLVVWNIQKARDPDWKRDLVELIAGAELVLLQEAGPKDKMKAGLAARHDLRWQLGASYYRWGRDESPTGVVTGAVASARSAVVIHSPTVEPLAQTPKSALLSLHALPDGSPDLMVINLHGINFRTARHLRAQLDVFGPTVSRHPGPVILAGDLNTHHRARTEVVEAFARDHGLTSAFSNGSPTAKRRPHEPDGRTRYMRWPLDQVYVRGLTVDYVRVFVDIDGSDHKPLQVGLSVQP